MKLILMPVSFKFCSTKLTNSVGEIEFYYKRNKLVLLESKCIKNWY